MSITVLLVDDQPLVRAALRTTLQTICENIIAEAAGSLEEASRQIKVSTPPNLVVLDLYLPDGRGLAALEAFRRRHPGLRTVVLAESLDLAIVHACRKSDELSLITRTSSIETVITCLRTSLAGQQFIEGDPAPTDSTPIPPRHDDQPVRPRWLRDRNAPARRPQKVAESGSSDAGGVILETPEREYHDGRHLGLTERQRGVLKLMMMGLPNKAICREMHLAEGTIKVHVSAVLRALGVSSRSQVTLAALRSGIQPDDIIL
ncbi:MAG: response regulator transcription factor [Lautropia sp.]|nr:response regulator transcription factor [Lautropia sp.]